MISAINDLMGRYTSVIRAISLVTSLLFIVGHIVLVTTQSSKISQNIIPIPHSNRTSTMYKRKVDIPYGKYTFQLIKDSDGTTVGVMYTQKYD